jgi:hypothetical protein
MEKKMTKADLADSASGVLALSNYQAPKSEALFVGRQGWTRPKAVRVDLWASSRSRVELSGYSKVIAKGTA